MSRSKPSRTSPSGAASTNASDVPVVGMREPCPCGSGRRYKACHGRTANRPEARVRRPFAGLPGECDWVAFREIVPAATAPLTLIDDPDRRVVLTTVLPMAWPALVRDNGDIYLALQVTTGSGDPSRDAAAALQEALLADPGTPIPPMRTDADGPRLQDLLAPVPLEITVHPDFDYWMSESSEASGEARESLDRANAKVMPTVRLSGVEAAYWVEMGDKRFLRWVMPHDEERMLDALARLHASGTDTLDGVPSRFVGSFRADGLLVPVWELVSGADASMCEAAAPAMWSRIEAAVASDVALTAGERRARAGLQTRQITLR